MQYSLKKALETVSLERLENCFSSVAINIVLSVHVHVHVHVHVRVHAISYSSSNRLEFCSLAKSIVSGAIAESLCATLPKRCVTTDALANPKSGWH
jgi:hypothetical protein